MDDPVVFLEVFVFAKIRRFGDHLIATFQIYPEYVIRGDFGANILDGYNSLMGIKFSPSLGYNGRVVFYAHSVCLTGLNKKVWYDTCGMNEKRLA